MPGLDAKTPSSREAIHQQLVLLVINCSHHQRPVAINRFSTCSILDIHLLTLLCAGINQSSSSDSFIPGDNLSPAFHILEKRSSRNQRKKVLPGRD